VTMSVIFMLYINWKLALIVFAIIPILLVIAINCASSLAGPALMGHAEHSLAAIDWYVAALFLAGGLAGGWAGGAIARRVDPRALKRVFAMFVLAVGLFIAASSTGLIPISVK